MSYLPGHAEKKEQMQTETIAIPHSSFLQAATYDAVNYSLTLDFKNGRQDVHRYVFPMVWQQFKESASHGSFYSRIIKGKYPTVNFKAQMKISDFDKLKKGSKKHAAASH